MNKYSENIGYDKKWLEENISNGKIIKCSCGLYRSRDSKKCPHKGDIEELIDIYKKK